MILQRLLAAALLASTALAMPQDRTAQAVDPALKKALASLIGVVDMAKVFDQMPRWAALRAEVDRKAEGYRTPINELDRQIGEQVATIKMLSEGEERRDREIQIELLKQQRQALFARARERNKLDQARALLAAYDDADVAIAKVAKARGLLLVVRQHDLGKPPADAAKLPTDALDERLTLHERRGLLWADDGLDITADVVRELMVPPAPDKKDADKNSGAQPTPAASTPQKTGG
jgi:Skp family chaperone for outer membrane proteins